MPMKRDRDVQVNLEEPVYKLMVQLAAMMGVSHSALMRRLMIDELRARGMLSDREIADMAMAS